MNIPSPASMVLTGGKGVLRFTSILLATNLLAMSRLRQSVGKWVMGPDEFWNREGEIRTFIEILDEGGSIHLVAQRRIGKTSLMREVSRRIGGRYVCVHVDLQKARSAEDFIAALGTATREHQSLWLKTREVFSNAFSKLADRLDALQIDEVTLTIREGLVGGNWQAKGDRLLAALAESEKPVVLFLDEVPVMVNRILRGTDDSVTPERIAATDDFLSWLRQNTLAHQGRLRLVVTGSIGFEPILREARLSATINHLRAFPLDPWDAPTAVGCLRALADTYGLTFEDGAPERMTALLGSCVPHHVQMFFAHAREITQKRGDATCTLADVDEAYRTRMVGTRGHAELSTFEERLKKVVPFEALPFVLDLLTEAAVVGHLSPGAVVVFRREHDLAVRTHDELVRRVLDVLEHDGYLRPRDDGRYGFVSNLLRDWWKGRHAFGFTPASKR